MDQIKIDWYVDHQPPSPPLERSEVQLKFYERLKDLDFTIVYYLMYHKHVRHMRNNCTALGNEQNLSSGLKSFGHNEIEKMMAGRDEKQQNRTLIRRPRIEMSNEYTLHPLRASSSSNSSSNSVSYGVRGSKAISQQLSVGVQMALSVTFREYKAFVLVYCK